jgi:citrate synthase
MTEIREGLEDVAVAETRLSHIDGENGELTIGGYPLAELAPNATYEETVYLLREGRLPDADELAAFREEFRALRPVPDATLALLRSAAHSEVAPMDALRMGIASANLDLAGEESERDALAAVARVPTVVAAYWRFRQGNGALDPDPELGHAADYLRMLTGETPSEAQVRGLQTYLNGVVDHGLNASTFTARAIVSTESDVFSAVTGAVGALKGPLHGGAPGPVLDMLEAIEDSGDAAEYVEGVLESGERLMGFGHRVYDVRDPRAAVLGDAAEAFYRGSDQASFFELASEVESVGVDLLEQYRPDLALETNVEFYTAVLLNGVGIDRDLFTPTFAVGRVGGWTAHCLEQLGDNRLIRPRGVYVGEFDREWVPADDR